MPWVWLFKFLWPSQKSWTLKVHMFWLWEGHKIFQNLHCRFDRSYIGKICSGNFTKKFVAFSKYMNFNNLYGSLKAGFVANGKCQESSKSFWFFFQWRIIVYQLILKKYTCLMMSSFHETFYFLKLCLIFDVIQCIQKLQ